MTDFKNIEGIYFVGIGGIGMSALALYFIQGGFTVAGYDRSESPLTDKLASLGCDIIFEDDPDKLPPAFLDRHFKDHLLVIYTPAITAESRILSYFRKNGFRLSKRSEILGEISSETDTIAVAGTHGKTTVSTMTAHLLKQSPVDCSAFLGGISKNYNSNLLIGTGRFTVIEADEFDRSFHFLNPLIAVITSVDADHLDIYGDHETMLEAFNLFCTRLRKGGTLFVNNKIREKIRIPEHVTLYTYGLDDEADYSSFNIDHRNDFYSFDLRTPEGIIKDLRFSFPGIINIENMTVAVAVSLICGVNEDDVRKGVFLFRGVKRRFDIRVNMPGLTYIDDYAHHPEEIKACITSVREYFRGRKITGIFQPHLYSRTRDHASGFARSLDELDEVILLPVYPAREKPIPGVSSELIFDKMTSASRKLMRREDIPELLDVATIDVLLTIGAGDIDKLVDPITSKLLKEGKR
jgi:UDP-N-acetylmuramate--alanine ligase